MVYDEPGNQFTAESYQWVVHHVDVGARGGDDGGGDDGGGDDAGEPEPAAAAPASPAPAQAAATGDVLGLDFFGGGSPAPAPAARAPSPAPVSSGGLDDFFGGGGGSPAQAPAGGAQQLKLDPSQKLDQNGFQNAWKANALTGTIAVQLGAQNVPKFKAALGQLGVQALAQKDMGQAYKLFMYATEVRASGDGG